MYTLTATHSHRYSAPITSPTLTGLRDQLITKAYQTRVADGMDADWADQLYAVEPWDLDDDEIAPTPREVTRELVIALAGRVWDASPKNIHILEGEDTVEYRVEHQHIDGGVWHPVTQWSPEWPLNDGCSVAPDERIMCRPVSPTKK